MHVWVWLVLTLAGAGVGVGVAFGELGGSDSWLLMVEAGRDGPERRITPKSVFIAPALASRAERCRPGYRYDHLGRCVKVVRVDPSAQLDLLLKRLQGIQGAKSPPVLSPQAPPSAGPLHFSLPLGTVQPTPPPLAPVTSSNSSSSTTSFNVGNATNQNQAAPTPSSELSTNSTSLLGSSTSSVGEEGTRAPAVTTTLETTKDTRIPDTGVPNGGEVTSPDEGTITSTSLADTSLTSWPSEEPEQGTTAVIEGSGDTTTSLSTLEGSGLTPTEAFEGSGIPSVIPVEGSGTEAAMDESPTPTAPEDRPERSTTVTSSEEVTATEPPESLDWVSPKPTSCCEESTPIPPSDTTASLLLAVLKGDVRKTVSPKVEVEIEKAEVVSLNDTESTTKAEDLTEAANGGDTTTESSLPRDTDDKTEQLPIIEYIDLILPNTEEASSEGKEGDRVLIPLENIKWNFSTGVNLAEKDGSEPLNRTDSAVSPKIETSFPNVPFFDGFKVESVEVDGLKPERTQPDDSQPEEHRIQDGGVINSAPEKQKTQDGVKPTTQDGVVDSQENKVATDAWWVETSPFGTSWVRFPDQQAVPLPHNQRRGPLDAQTAESGTVPGPRISSRFRFPEEAVAPEHRATILKFWSRIPMFQSQEPAQKDDQSNEQNWFAP